MHTYILIMHKFRKFKYKYIWIPLFFPPPFPCTSPLAGATAAQNFQRSHAGSCCSFQHHRLCCRCVIPLISTRHMTHSCVWHAVFICVTWRIHVCSMPLPSVWRDEFMCVACCFHLFDVTRPCLWHATFICVTWLVHVCDMTHPHAWHDAYVCVVSHIHMCGSTLSCVWHRHRPDAQTIHDAFTCVIWLTFMCDITHSYAWHKAFLCETITFLYMCDRHETYICVTWRVHVCDVTRSCMWLDSFFWVTWLIPTCKLTISYVCDRHEPDAWFGNDLFINVTQLLHMICFPYLCGHFLLCVWHDLFLYVTCMDLMLGLAMSHSFMWHDYFMHVLCSLYMCGMTYVWHDICVAWHMCGMTYVWHDICVAWHILCSHHPFIHVTRFFHTCDMTPLYVWHDIFCVAITHSYMWHDFFIHVMWLLCMCDMTYSVYPLPIHTCDTIFSYMWYDSFVCVTWHILCSQDSFIYVTQFFHILDVPPLYVWHEVPSVTRPFDTCVTGMTYWVWHDPFIHVWQAWTWCAGYPWLIHTCDTILSYMWYASCTYIYVYIYTYIYTYMCIYV